MKTILVYTGIFEIISVPTTQPKKHFTWPFMHIIIVYTVDKDTQSECVQPCHCFQKSLFWSSKTVSSAFLKVQVENTEVV